MESESVSTPDLIRTHLRHLRTAAGMSQEDFGKLVHYSASMVSAIELGTRPLDEKFLTRADEVLKTGGLLTSLLRIARREEQPSWFRPWLDAERAARQLRCFEPTLVPGLLQTERYAHAVLRANSTLTESQVEELLGTRLERQKILNQDDPPQFIAVLDEAVIRRCGESFKEVMTEQLLHLASCLEHPHISIHVIPRDVVIHTGLSGPFALARGADSGWVGHLEHQLGGDVIDNDDDITSLLSRWETVRNDALPRRQSAELIREVVESWTSPVLVGARQPAADPAAATASR